MQVTAVVHVLEMVDLIVILKMAEQVTHVEHAVGVELDALRTNGRGEVKLTPGLQHLIQAGKAFEVCTTPQKLDSLAGFVK